MHFHNLRPVYLLSFFISSSNLYFIIQQCLINRDTLTTKNINCNYVQFEIVDDYE